MTIDFGGWLSIGIVQTIDFGDCLLNGIVRTIDSGAGLSIGIVQTTDFGDSFKLSCPDNWFQSLAELAYQLELSRQLISVTLLN